jgi:hypothetical protein
MGLLVEVGHRARAHRVVPHGASVMSSTRRTDMPAATDECGWPLAQSPVKFPPVRSGARNGTAEALPACHKVVPHRLLLIRAVGSDVFGADQSMLLELDTQALDLNPGAQWAEVLARTARLLAQIFRVFEISDNASSDRTRWRRAGPLSRAPRVWSALPRRFKAAPASSVV